uniref:Disease resistance R13L4/SHOC-2-like LRR domain-containing protein n=1 Tax=Salix viminalis TaxID=40686 RepID=A0A6N2K9M0_SALVM
MLTMKLSATAHFLGGCATLLPYISMGKILMAVSQKLYRNYHTLNNCKQRFKLYGKILVIEHHEFVSSLWANYLSGNIPPEWANTKLEILFLDVNRLTGKIPSYLGKITTLRYLSIENNMFYGTVPPELGDLVNLESLTLSANNLSGELPLALANLIRLKQLRLSSNNFTGRIPEFIQSWKQLDALDRSCWFHWTHSFKHFSLD